jgi:hypothetical protein
MESLFKIIEPESVSDPEIRGDVEALWSERDLSALRAVVDRLLGGEDELGRCAVLNLYSYQCTTHGEWLRDVFAGMLLRLLNVARAILQRASRGDLPEERRALLEASAMHVIWRGVEMEDAPLVLESLRSERDARVIFPTLWAARLMRGNDDAFDRQSAPLLARVAEREDLSSDLRRDAIDAIGESPHQQDLDLLARLLPRLPAPVAASCAMILLDSDPSYQEMVRDAAREWPACDEYPVPDVLERLGA